MASFSQTIIGKYGVDTYQQTKNTYDWLLKVIHQINSESDEIKVDFHFCTGEVSCSCNTIEEFVDNAYGASEYSFTTMHISIKNYNDFYISVDSQNQIRITANNKIVLAKMVQLLNDIVLYESELDDPISVPYVEDRSSTIIINGNSNTVASNFSAVTNVDSDSSSESKIRQILNTIWQNLLSNWIWYILCLGAGALLSWAASKGYISR